MELLARLAEEPRRAAIVLDIDGTLAPIVPRPADARIPDATLRELARLAGRYALVACISGRAEADAQRLVGLAQVVVVGNHGLELDPDAGSWRTRLAAFLAHEPRPAEDKGLTAAFHFRGAADERAARDELEQIAARARAAGFETRYGRKVLEILPPLPANKGSAVLRLTAERGLTRALYAGDDTTDLDAFRALERLELGVRVAVVSAEAPAGLAEAADLVVAGPDELRELLRTL